MEEQPTFQGFKPIMTFSFRLNLSTKDYYKSDVYTDGEMSDVNCHSGSARDF